MNSMSNNKNKMKGGTFIFNLGTYGPNNLIYEWRKLHRYFEDHFKYKNNLLFHYTALDTFWAIAENDLFYAQNARFSNDSKEYNFGRKTIEERCIDISYNGNRRHFIMCFCEKGNDLSQWREYAKNGVSIGLDLNAINQYYLLNNEHTQHHIQEILDEEDMGAEGLTEKDKELICKYGDLIDIVDKGELPLRFKRKSNEVSNHFYAISNKPFKVFYYDEQEIIKDNKENNKTKEKDNKENNKTKEKDNKEKNKTINDIIEGYNNNYNSKKKNSKDSNNDGVPYWLKLTLQNIPPYIKDSSFSDEKEYRLSFGIKEKIYSSKVHFLTTDSKKIPFIKVIFGNVVSSSIEVKEIIICHNIFSELYEDKDKFIDSCIKKEIDEANCVVSIIDRLPNLSEITITTIKEDMEEYSSDIYDENIVELYKKIVKKYKKLFSDKIDKKEMNNIETNNDSGLNKEKMEEKSKEIIKKCFKKCLDKSSFYDRVKVVSEIDNIMNLNVYKHDNIELDEMYIGNGNDKSQKLIRMQIENLLGREISNLKLKIWCRGHVPIRKIFIAPSPYQESIYESVKEYCTSVFWLKSVDIVKSEIPYRNGS